MGVSMPGRAIAWMIAFLVLQAAEPAPAGDVFIRKGEGGAGLDAWVELGDSRQLTLGLVGCRIKRNTRDLQLILSVSNATEVSPDLKKLVSVVDGATQELDVCVNGICEGREFRTAESPWGDVLVRNVTIDRKQKEMRAIRIVVPGETTRYEYRGDLDQVLTRICRR
ncbi:MAG: hypothetical protein PS018_20955 [bacterium]|nr:hypothetical protein [bacterium]